MSIAADCDDFFPIVEENEIYNNEYVIGELTFKWFEKVVDVAILEVNNHTVCDTCRYRVKRSWKSGKSIQKQLLKESI